MTERIRFATVGVLLGFLWTRLLLAALAMPPVGGDTPQVLAGIRGAAEWSELSYFSLLAHGIVGSLAGLGDDAFVYRGIVVLNAISFLVAGAAGACLLWQRSATFAGLLWPVALMGSPLCYYAFSVSVESVVAMLTALFVMALLARWPLWAMGGLAFLLGTAKETNPPLVAGMALVVWLIERRARPGREALAVGIASGGALLANFAFNWIRFGTWRNGFYLQAQLQVDSLDIYLDHLAALWLSPNGGLVLHWPLFILAVVGLMAARRPVPAFLVLGFASALTVALARWHAPFGWLGWSNRLVVTWIPALLLLSLAASPTGALRLPYRAAISAVVIGLGLPQLWAALSPEVQILIFRPTTVCPRIPGSFWEDIPYYYRCLHEYFWVNGDTFLVLYRHLLVAPTHLAATLLLVVAASIAATQGNPRALSPSHAVHRVARRI